MARQFRRVVTGHRADGRSVFVFDGIVEKTFSRGPGTTVVTDLWATDCTPADSSGEGDPTGQPFRLLPPAHGSVFRMIEIPPDSERIEAMRRAEAGFQAQQEGYRRDFKNARHPGFHTTATVDYVIVLSGEIHALVDEGECRLLPGDMLVQRGTSHAWSNRGTEPALLAVVLIDAEPVGEASA